MYTYLHTLDDYSLTSCTFAILHLGYVLILILASSSRAGGLHVVMFSAVLLPHRLPQGAAASLIY